MQRESYASETEQNTRLAERVAPFDGKTAFTLGRLHVVRYRAPNGVQIETRTESESQMGLTL